MINKDYVLRELESYIDNNYISVLEKYQTINVILKLIHREFNIDII